MTDEIISRGHPCTYVQGVLWYRVKGPVTFTADIPPEKSKAVRVRNLPQKAVVGVAVQARGEVVVSFLNDTDYKRFPHVKRPLFQGRVEKQFSFSVTIPAPGDYFVVFHNTSGTNPRSITVTVRAARRTHATLGKSRELPGYQRGLADAEEKLRRFERKLNKIFVFQPFPIRAKQCGAPKAFAGSTGIVLCREYSQKLYVVLGDKTKAAALYFTPQRVSATHL